MCLGRGTHGCILDPCREPRSCRVHALCALLQLSLLARAPTAARAQATPIALVPPVPGPTWARMLQHAAGTPDACSPKDCAATPGADPANCHCNLGGQIGGLTPCPIPFKDCVKTAQEKCDANPLCLSFALCTEPSVCKPTGAPRRLSPCPAPWHPILL